MDFEYVKKHYGVPACVGRRVDGIVYGEMGTIRKVTRSQRRYMDFLKVADCFDDFKHYLKYKSRPLITNQ